jgi:hypothetical protein
MIIPLGSYRMVRTQDHYEEDCDQEKSLHFSSEAIERLVMPALETTTRG